MVKKGLLFLLLFCTLQADDALYEKIKSLIGVSVFERNRAFIEIVFSPNDAYYMNDRLDVVKITETLKENGLLNLFFSKPQSLEMTFSTNGSPLFFVKLMGETLRSMGYYRYITEESRLDNSSFHWRIRLTTEYATDPSILQTELRKRGCDIIDIGRENAQEWTYEIDMSQAHLNLEPIQSGEEVLFKRSLDPHWLNVADVKKVTMWSLKTNNWYPYVTFYDGSLRLLRVYKRDKKTWQITIPLPRDTVYIKIADLYSLKNIKDGLRIEGIGEK